MKNFKYIGGWATETEGVGFVNPGEEVEVTDEVAEILSKSPLFIPKEFSKKRGGD